MTKFRTSSFDLSGFRWFILLFFSTVGFILTYHSEKSPLFGGYGSDGLAYGHFSLGFEKEFREHRVPIRMLERVLPVYAVHLMLKIQGVEPVPEKMIIPEEQVGFHHKVLEAYMLYNLLVFIASVFFWMLITEKLNLGISSTLVSSFLLFVNFANIKQYFYEPVMIDPTVFFAGILLAFSLAFRSYTALYFVAVITLFINAAAVYYCLVVAAFPLSSPPLKQAAIHGKFQSRLFALAVTLFISGLAIYYFFSPLCPEGSEPTEIPTAKNWFPLSLVAVAVYVFAGFLSLTDSLLQVNPVAALRTFRWKPWLILLLVMLLVQYFFNKYGARLSEEICADKPFTVWNYFIYSLRYSYARPAAMASAHFAYFGLAFISLSIYWRQIIQEGSNYGLGTLLILSMTLLHSLTSETRHLLFMFPVSMMLLFSAFREIKFNSLTVAIILLLCIAASKVWFPINPLNSEDYIFHPEPLQQMLHSPLQKYFMNLGPWMNNRMYLLHLLLGVAAFVVCGAIIRTKPKLVYDSVNA
ncbi:MAG TPA: hypothetical protein VNJ07_08345 [Chitinophagales bacterium]|nr:hypothetical protein [Chitinophagales bacterium]